MKTKKLNGYKGFDQDLKCRNFQYEVGNEYEEKDKIELCENGFHFCPFPLDVFIYYPPTDGKELNRFCSVTGSGEVEKDRRNCKNCSSKIRINDEIGLEGLIKAGVQAIKDKHHRERARCKSPRSVVSSEEAYSTVVGAEFFTIAANSGDCSTAISNELYSISSNTGQTSLAESVGDHSISATTDDTSIATASGGSSIAASSGSYSAAVASQCYSAATCVGFNSAAISSGRNSVATNISTNSAAISKGVCSAATSIGPISATISTGDASAAFNIGNGSLARCSGGYSIAVNDGDGSAASVEGEESIAVATGVCGRAKGALGCWIILAEYAHCKKRTIKCIKVFKVDGKTIKANTYYQLRNGEPVEV